MELRAVLEAPASRSRLDPDAALVAAAREDPQAFLALYDRYFDRVLGYVRLRIHDEPTCEDVTSTVFTAALGQLRRFRGDGPFAGWLFQIARNAVRDVRVRTMSPPANLIVHVREAGVQADGTPVSAEWWQETNPPYAIRIIKGPTDQQQESASDGTTNSVYDAGGNTIDQQPSSKAPALIDPVETVRAELSAGTATVTGTVTIGGRSLYEVDLPNGVIGYFDRTGYRPVYIDNPQRDGSVVRTHVLVYEELPLTPESQRLLSLTAQHPDARIATTAAREVSPRA